MKQLLIPFEQISESEFSLVGGKTYTLARLLQAGYAVPPGAGLTRLPESEEEWLQIFSWWEHQGQPALAVRSSGIEEDSLEHSFAGQHRTFLDIKDQDSLRNAIKGCFASASTAAAAAYRDRMTIQSSPGPSAMGVTLQHIVRPQFAGVCFTRDPRGSQKALLEWVCGFGESLVSGHETPEQMVAGEEPSAHAFELGWKKQYSHVIFETAAKMKVTLGYEADIEWAIDRNGRLWILQARPITTFQDGQTSVEARERKRLAAGHSPNTIWDGQTFAEWTGAPTPLSFAIWQQAFTRSGALGRALHELGYLGSESQELWPNESVLESVFARPFVNLSRMETLYFGATPFEMVPTPRPHLTFRWHKLNLKSILNFLPGTWRMIRTAWRLGTGKRAILLQSEQALAAFQRTWRLPSEPSSYTQWNQANLLARFQELSQLFSNEALLEPLKLMVAIESAQQALIRGIGDDRLNEWLATRLRLPSVAMTSAYAEACNDPTKQASFLAHYGHRGPGELDLSRPRWVEMGNKAFADFSAAKATPKAPMYVEQPVRSVREKMAEDDWALLSAMLVLREHWKDALLGLYSNIRWIVLELGRKSGWGEELFWFHPFELTRALSQSTALTGRLHGLAERRKSRHEQLYRISLPMVFKLADLDPNREQKIKQVEKGVSLSGGIAYGEIRLVTDPTKIDWDQWPENAILVAETTDPGWTPLFVRSRAVVTGRGGALSHCAIVAREMGLPAVSGIHDCMSKFQEGEHVWVDGTHGLVTRA